jgi:hypothetical protein
MIFGGGLTNCDSVTKFLQKVERASANSALVEILQLYLQFPAFAGMTRSNGLGVFLAFEKPCAG